MYAGPPRHWSDVAVLWVDTNTIGLDDAALDGNERVFRKSSSSCGYHGNNLLFELLPGPHTLKAGIDVAWDYTDFAGGRQVERRCTIKGDPVELAFVAEAGHSYRLKYMCRAKLRGKKVLVPLIALPYVNGGIHNPFAAFDSLDRSAELLPHIWDRYANRVARHADPLQDVHNQLSYELLVKEWLQTSGALNYWRNYCWATSVVDHELADVGIDPASVSFNFDKNPFSSEDDGADIGPPEVGILDCGARSLHISFDRTARESARDEALEVRWRQKLTEGVQAVRSALHDSNPEE